MPQVINGCANVGPNGVLHDRARIRPIAPRNDRLHRRSDPVHDKPHVVRVCRCSSENVVHRRENRAALRMAHHDDEPRPKARSGKLHATDLRRCDDVAGHADHEEIPEPLIEYQFGGNPRVRAAQHDGERRLPRDKRRAVCGTRNHRCGCLARDESAIAVTKVIKRVPRRHHDWEVAPHRGVGPPAI